MLFLSVDPAFAFDFLSILEVKSKLSKHSKIYYGIISDEISEQIGASIFDEILTSAEYQALLNANKLVFDAVEKAKSDKVTASEVDRLNFQRYHCKLALQKKFFNNEELAEEKFGYE